MKIGIPICGCDAGKSGIGQYLIHLLREFSAMGKDLEIEALVHKSEEKIFIPQSDNISRIILNDGLRRPILNVLWSQIALPHRRWRGKWDVLFLPAANRRAPFLPLGPSVGMVHDFSSLHICGKYDPARDFYIKKVLPALMRRMTLIVTNSECSKRDIVQYVGIAPERIRAIPLAADTDFFTPGDKGLAAEKIAKKFGVRTPYILYISRIEHPGKNHERLIRAFDRLKQTEGLPHQLLLAGSDWTRSEQVHRAAEKAKFSQDIVFTGFAPPETMPDLCRGADLFVYPSLYEGFGLPILEAMACATPVACSNTSSMPEVAGDAAETFDPSDEESIEQALRLLLTDRKRLEKLSKLGLARSRQFSWSATAHQTIQAFRDAAEQ